MKAKQKLRLNRLERPDGKEPVAIYARVSSTGQDVENSTEAQIKECRRWAEAHGYVVVKVFTDKAKSGRIEQRPDFQQMVSATDDPDCPFVKVLVWRFSRFFREYVLSVIYRERLLKNQVKVLSVNEPLDDSPLGRLVQHVLDAINAFQSEIIAQDVQMGTHNLAARGFFVGGTAPDGMRKLEVDDEGKQRYKLEPDPKTQHKIRRIFDLALQYKTESRISITLREEGILNSNGNLYAPNRIHDVLTNRHYEGTIVWGKTPTARPRPCAKEPMWALSDPMNLPPSKRYWRPGPQRLLTPDRPAATTCYQNSANAGSVERATSIAQQETKKASMNT